MHLPRLLFLLYLLISGIFILLPTSPIQGQRNWTETIEIAEEALQNYQLEKVKVILETQLESTSNKLLLDSLLLSSKYQFALGHYQEAKYTIQKAEQLATKNADSLALFKFFIWKSRIHIEWIELASAKKAFQKAEKLANKLQLTNTVDYKRLQYYWGLLKIAEHEYEAADSAFQIILQTPNLKTQSNNLYYQATYSLGESKREQEHFLKADSILNQVKIEIDKNKGAYHYLNINVLNHLGRIYTETEKYEDGIESFELALKLIQKNKLGKKHPIYAKLLINYGRLLQLTGKYKKAEEMLLDAEVIYKATYNETSNYAFMIVWLGILYEKLGKQDKRLFYAIKQKEIFKNSGRFSDYARTLNNLSTIYVDQQKFQEAEALFTEGIDILKANKQTETSLYAALLMNYAALNIDLEKYKKAQNLSEEARIILAKVFSKKHPWYASVINNLAYIYKKTGDFKKAKTYYLETENIDGETLGKRHPYYIGTTYSLANITELATEIDTAYHYYQRANTGQVNLIYNYYSGFDEAVRLSYLTTTEADFHKFLSFAFRHQQAIPTLSTDAQDLNLAIKNLALDFSADNQSLANEIKDSATIKIYQDWLATKKQLSQSYIQSPAEQAASGIDLLALEEKAELLEKELVRNEVLATAQLTQQKRTSFEDFKSTIQANEAVIDFIRFPYYLPDRQTDSVYYCALINRSDFDQPKMVLLGEEKQLKRLLRSNVRLNGGNYVENQISVSGLLHKVSFAALYVDDKPLLDHYNFTYYGNLRAYGQTSKINITNQSISLFGGANFNLDSIQLTQIAQQYKKDSKVVNTIPIPTTIPASNAADTSNTRSAVTFNYLQGTQKEVESIAQQFQVKNWQAQTFVNHIALEENFKSLTGQKAPSILHIATHGYFYAPLKEGRKVPDNTRGRIMSAKNPLLRSGLALSGANYSWKLGKRIPNLEDGILTAYEIAQQNLGNTNLVVLSACETGLGDVVNGEGVFGLQRAFKMAGVKNMLISLWKVPDFQTQELMTTFYQFYLQSNDASDALYQAQLAMSKKYRPFYWAGFILAK